MSTTSLNFSDSSKSYEISCEDEDYDTDKEKNEAKKSNEKFKKKTKHRQQKYKREWEHKFEFKYWISSVKDDVYSAKCLICNICLKSELSVLKAHGKSLKHLNKSSGNFINIKK